MPTSRAVLCGGRAQAPCDPGQVMRQHILRNYWGRFVHFQSNTFPTKPPDLFLVRRIERWRTQQSPYRVYPLILADKIHAIVLENLQRQSGDMPPDEQRLNRGIEQLQFRSERNRPLHVLAGGGRLLPVDHEARDPGLHFLYQVGGCLVVESLRLAVHDLSTEAKVKAMPGQHPGPYWGFYGGVLAAERLVHGNSRIGVNQKDVKGLHGNSSSVSPPLSLSDKIGNIRQSLGHKGQITPGTESHLRVNCLSAP